MMRYTENIRRVKGIDNNRISSPRTREKKNKQNKRNRTTVLEQFIVDFACELDLFDSGTVFPSWVFDYRDDHIRKLSPEMRKIAKWLRGMGLRFKMKWPIEIDGKWKFADFFFPKQRTVIIVANPMENFSPIGMSGERARFFHDRFRVIEIETLADLERKMRMKAATV